MDRGACSLAVSENCRKLSERLPWAGGGLCPTVSRLRGCRGGVRVRMSLRARSFRSGMIRCGASERERLFFRRSERLTKATSRPYSVGKTFLLFFCFVVPARKCRMFAVLCALFERRLRQNRQRENRNVRQLSPDRGHRRRAGRRRKSDSTRRFGSPVYRNGGYSYGLFFLSGVAVQRDEHLVDPGGIHIDDFEIEIMP